MSASGRAPASPEPTGSAVTSCGPAASVPSTATRADGQRGRLQTPRALDVGVIPPPVLRADHHERLGGQLGGPFQDPLNEARIARGGVGEGSEREREAQDDEPPSRGNQCRTTSEHDSPTKKTPSREFHRPLPGRSVLELGAPISLGWRTEYRKDG